MPIVPVVPKLQSMGKVASPFVTTLLPPLVPTVPINHLFNVVDIESKGGVGMKVRVYARKSFYLLGTGMSTRMPV